MKIKQKANLLLWITYLIAIDGSQFDDDENKPRYWNFQFWKYRKNCQTNKTQIIFVLQKEREPFFMNNFTPALCDV